MIGVSLFFRVLIFGAQDTTSAALSRILYLLSIHPGIQATVREEIRTALRDRRDDGGEAPGRLAYEDVLALPWLDAVVRETMRLWVLYARCVEQR